MTVIVSPIASGTLARARARYPDPDNVRMGLEGPGADVLRAIVLGSGEGLLPNHRPMHPVRPAGEGPAVYRPNVPDIPTPDKHVTRKPADGWSDAALKSAVANIEAGRV